MRETVFLFYLGRLRINILVAMIWMCAYLKEAKRWSFHLVLLLFSFYFASKQFSISFVLVLLFLSLLIHFASMIFIFLLFKFEDVAEKEGNIRKEYKKVYDKITIKEGDGIDMDAFFDELSKAKKRDPGRFLARIIYLIIGLVIIFVIFLVFHLFS
ncbi:hypothetical protein CVU82_02055 [Candidatus Falkowbacteria bacterium HGW-Falkowbacteria-1]|uniref:Uncharacterized protein n=1 Tax=Candidatus Falkowbacteria bacterium HGW-Falkowbacteria-1 TaxID=2013768 RepID=A0A2N2E9I7_9BACT|nr:MAG: hypothetical protein CVU82_02055 [Candidatus Falkowbacteria bacterium HGW-Falkowbacteria-1]